MPVNSPAPTPAPLHPAGQIATSFVDELFDRTPLSHAPFQSTLKTAVSLFLLAVLFFVAHFLLRRLIQGGTERIVQREEKGGSANHAARVRTLAGLTQSVLVYTLGFIFLVAALGTLGFNLAGLIGTAGVAGVALGFGAQKLVKDVITGGFILLEDQYAVGDYVTIGTVTGTVEEIALRTTRIRDDDGRLYILSNGDIAQVCNQSRGPVSGSFEIAVAAFADTKQVAETLNTAFAALPEDIPLAEPPNVEGIAGADAAKTTFRIVYKAATGTKPAALAPRLRDIARRALHDADIPLA